MFKKSALTALTFISVGLVFGALLVSSFQGRVDLGFAGTGDNIVLGGPAPVTMPDQTLRSINESFTAVARAVTPTVVYITVTTTGRDRSSRMPRDFFHFFGPEFRPPEPEPSQGAGSGVIITPDGYIATNNHVVEGATSGGIEVTLHDRTRYRATLVGTDPLTDLAVIKIDAKDLPVAALGNSDEVQVGEWVLAIGNPLGLTSTVTAGIVSAIGRGNIGVIRDAQGYGIENFIQTDAAINPGNSGGSLVNMKGEVVGINTAIATTNARYQGYGFAVPVNLLTSVARDLITKGKVMRGYIGVSITTVDQTMASALGLERTQGVLVQSLVKGGAAEAAGLKERDVILSIDGREVNASNELQTYVAIRAPGDVVTLKIFRDGKVIEKKVTLRARDEDTTAVRASDTRPPGTESVEPATAITLENLGLTIRPLTSDEKKSAEVEQGVIVSEVKPYSEAFSRNIRSNDIILEADRKPVTSPSDLKKTVEARKPGDSILLRVKGATGQAYYTAVQIPKN
jgi:serine protease Do